MPSAWPPPLPPQNPTRRRGSGALITGVLALCGTAYTAAVNPNTSHAFPWCPLKLVTGLDCPFCGSLRAVHSLSHGHIGEALGHNALFVLSVPYLLAFWGTWMARDLGHPAPNLRLPRTALVAVVMVLAAFTVARNLPWEPLHWLNSTSA